MSAYARKVSDIKMRFFKPSAFDLVFHTPYYQAVNGITSEMFRVSAVGDGTTTVFPIPANVIAPSVDSINCYFDTVLQPNPGLDFYTVLITGQSRALYYYEIGTGINQVRFRSPPAAGVKIDLDVFTKLNSNNWFKIPLNKKLIQGAFPVDPQLISSTSAINSGQFQGGCRCRLELRNTPKHGQFRIGADQTSIEYMPELGYFGLDSFSYRVVNAWQQASDEACITMYVGI